MTLRFDADAPIEEPAARLLVTEDEVLVETLPDTVVGAVRETPVALLWLVGAWAEALGACAAVFVLRLVLRPEPVVVVALVVVPEPGTTRELETPLAAALGAAPVVVDADELAAVLDVAATDGFPAVVDAAPVTVDAAPVAVDAAPVDALLVVLGAVAADGLLAAASDGAGADWLREAPVAGEPLIAEDAELPVEKPCTPTAFDGCWADTAMPWFWTSAPLAGFTASAPCPEDALLAEPPAAHRLFALQAALGAVPALFPGALVEAPPVVDGPGLFTVLLAAKLAPATDSVTLRITVAIAVE